MRPVLSPTLRSAAAFADAALRRVLEVLELRRPPAHLSALLAPGLLDAVLAGRPAAPKPPGAATLLRLRVQPAGSPAAAEVFGSFRRAGRVHALAGRVEQASTGPGWQLVALHIG